MLEVLRDLRPEGLWRHFGELTRIPRPSGQEQAAAEYVKRVAQERGAVWRQDEMGNLVVYTGGGRGPVVAVQAHLDMVCEKEPEVAHNFSSDPIAVKRDGDRIFARGTTLGADNGIGAAACLALLTEEGVIHGPLELVFTVQEETGLHGAVGLDPRLLSARMLINLDSESPDHLTVGCAGGASVQLLLPVESERLAQKGWTGYRLSAGGLRGGHSGVEIHLPRANAIKLLTGALDKLLEQKLDLRIASLQGGSSHNVIPREAAAVLVVPEGGREQLAGTAAAIERDLHAEWPAHEPNLSLTGSWLPAPDEVLTTASRDKLLGLLSQLPHGVERMSEQFAGVVETSSNLAYVRCRAGEPQAAVLTSVRSLSSHQLFRMRSAVATLGARLGAGVRIEAAYPGWEPDPESVLLKVARECYLQVNGKPAGIEVIHAGLECGVLAAKVPGMQAVSFGPMLTGAHSPNEQVRASTVESMWKLLVSVLEALQQDPGVSP